MALFTGSAVFSALAWARFGLGFGAAFGGLWGGFAVKSCERLGESSSTGGVRVGTEICLPLAPLGGARSFR